MASRPRRITFSAAPAGGTWIAGDRLWLADASGELSRIDLGAAEPRVIGSGRGHRIWVWTDRRLLAVDGAKVTADYDVPARTNFGGVRHLFEDQEGTVWISTSRYGVSRFTEGEVKRVMTYTSVASVTQDREGSIWVATDGGGVAQLREKSYRVFNAALGLPQDVVSSLSEDTTGRIWLANRSGGMASVVSDALPQPVGLSGTRRFVNVVCADARNRIWFGGGRNGLLRWEQGHATPVQMPEPAADLHLLFRAQNGDMWFAADPHQLGFYRADTLRTISAADGFPPQAIRAMAQDRKGDIWLGGRNGELLRWNGQTFERFSLPPDFPRAPIHAIHADAANDLWIATASGLIVKDAGGFHLLTETNGLADDIIQEIVDDERGHLWFAARRGLFYAAKTDLFAATRDASRRVESRRLGPNEGLVGLTPMVNYHPTALRARDGLLWFATAQGAVAVDPSRQARHLPMPPVLIDEVRLDGRVLSQGAPLRIPSGRHRIEFRLAALSFSAPENVLLRHHLEGADPDWVDTGPDRAASYSNLPPGNYRLGVRARDSTGRWNDAGAGLAFTVVPAWWETVAFRMSVAALLLVGVAWLARRLVHRGLQRRLRVLEQQHALQKERTRIARDLHDDLGASLTEVGLLTDRLVEGAPRDFASQLAGLATRVRRVATELSSIVWTMNGEHSSLQDLASFLRRYTERLFRSTGTRALVSGVESIPPVPLPPGVQHHVLAATREALNNTLKHAHATEVYVKMHYTAGLFEVHAGDNGIGFNAAHDAGSDGNGLRNMRARLEEIGGTFELTSSPASGTHVTLRVPVATAKPPGSTLTHANKSSDR